MRIQAKRYNLNFSYYTVNELEEMARKGERLILTDEEIEDAEAEREATAKSLSSGRGGVTPNSYDKDLLHIQKLYESAIRFPAEYQRCINNSAAHSGNSNSNSNSNSSTSTSTNSGSNKHTNLNRNNSILLHCRFFPVAAAAAAVTVAVVLSGASSGVALKK